MDQIISLNLDNESNQQPQSNPQNILQDDQMDLQLGDINLDSFDFTDIARIDTQHDIGSSKVASTEKVFNGEFYVNYLGININTIYSENTEILKMLIYMNNDKQAVKALIEDLELFIPHCLNKYNENINTINTEIAKNAIAKLEDFLRMLKSINLNKDTISFNNSQIQDRINSLQSKNSIGELIQDPNYKKIVFDSIRLNLVKRNSIINLLKSVKELILTEKSLIKAIESTVTKRLLEEYNQITYTYTQEEIDTLKQLDFLNIYGKEGYLKTSKYAVNFTSNILANISRAQELLMILYNQFAIYDSIKEFQDQEDYIIDNTKLNFLRKITA